MHRLAHIWEPWVNVYCVSEFADPFERRDIKIGTEQCAKKNHIMVILTAIDSTLPYCDFNILITCTALIIPYKNVICGSRVYDVCMCVFL